MNNPKFKIGDKVKCVLTSKGSDDDCSYGGAGWVLNKKFKIAYITRNCSPYIYWDSQNRYGVWEHHLELVKRNIKPYGIVNFMNNINKK